MKTLALLTIAAVALLSSCASTPQSRVNHHPEMFAKLSEADKQAVQAGGVRKGMTKDAVYLAWGSPSRILVGERNGKAFEKWRYNTLQPVYTGAYGMGVGVGYWHPRHFRYGFYDPYFYGAPAIAYVPTEGRYVEFINGAVTAFQVPLPY